MSLAAVRSPDPAGGSGLVQATLAAKYDVAPGQVTCSFEYDLQPARGPVAPAIPDVVVATVRVALPNLDSRFRDRPSVRADIAGMAAKRDPRGRHFPYCRCDAYAFRPCSSR